MNESRHEQPYGPKLGLSMLLLCACMVLVVGVAWGRYRTEISADIQYYPGQLSKIYLWGSPNEAGGYDPLPSTWALTTTESSVDFTVTNGIPGAEGQEDLFAGEDLEFYIRMVATEGIRDGANISIRMEMEAPTDPTDPDDPETPTDAQNSTDPTEGAEPIIYIGTPVKIEEGSPLYDSFGGGWVYYFYDTDGTEAGWTLEGGKLTAFTATIVSAAQKNEMDPSMLQLQVVAAENK